MRGNLFFNTLALVGVVTLLASGFLAAASPAPETTYAAKADEAEGQEPMMGICVIGVESPCNGDAVDDAGEVKDAPKGSGQIHCIRAPCELAPEDPNHVPAEGDDPRFGICVVGADSPCNGEGYGSEFNDAGDAPQEKRAPEQADEPVEDDGRVA